MDAVFFFGTLRHTPLLEVVLGDITHVQIRRMDLDGHRVERAGDGSFPVISAAAGSVATGILVEGLRAQDIARLEYYEKTFDCRLGQLASRDGPSVQAYLPDAGCGPVGGAWSLEDWERDWAALNVRAAQEVMGYFGQRSPTLVAQMYPMICARAWSQVNARHSRHGAGTSEGTITVAERRRPYANFFALDEFDLTHSRFDGRKSEIATRAVFMAADAALVLPYDPVRDRVMLVEQMRMGPLARGDVTCWQLEPIAGRIDPGETPEQTARREAMEEAGLELGALHTVSEAYASPGTSTEFYYTYVAIADLPDAAAGLGGLEAEQEDIRSHLMSFDALMELCDSQQAANVPLVISAYWLARHRDRLRSPS
ncbi:MULTISPECIES: NUDIX domain-containing protein [Roseobacteraceae]|uniref:NUDIX domain-containing protein n=1 Tax=Roseobacteraceae TaxID=2854170 RepID=UPI003299900C